MKTNNQEEKAREFLNKYNELIQEYKMVIREGTKNSHAAVVEGNSIFFEINNTSGSSSFSNNTIIPIIEAS